MPPTNGKIKTTKARKDVVAIQAVDAETVLVTPTVNSVWASKAVAGSTRQVTLPSSQTCIVRALGIEEFIMSGVLLDLDGLTPLISAMTPPTPGQAVVKAKGGHKRKGEPDVQAEMSDEDMGAFVMKNPTMLVSVISMADKVIPYIVVDPPVLLHYTGTGADQKMIPEKDRVPGAVYTDMIDLIDKMTLFTEGVGDLGALAAFRDTATTALGNLESEPSV